MSKRKSKNNALDLVLNLVTIALCVFVIIGIFVSGVGFGLSSDLAANYSILNLFNIDVAGYNLSSTASVLTALFGLFAGICALVIAILAVLKLFGVKLKYGRILTIIFGILVALFAILTFLMLPIDKGFDALGKTMFFRVGMWFTFIPGILLLPVTLFCKK